MTTQRLAGAVLILGMAALPPTAHAHGDMPGGGLSQATEMCPVDADGVDADGDGDPANDIVCRHLAAGDGYTTMADGRVLYSFGFSDMTGQPMEHVVHDAMLAAEAPAPTLEVREGRTLYLTLSNVGMMMRPDLFDPHSVHWHGYANAAPAYDGVPDASVSVNMGSHITYIYKVPAPGTYMYHCHVEATEHIQMGMVGNLVVTPRQDGSDLEFPVGSGRHYTRFAYDDGDGSTGYQQAYVLQIGGYDSFFHDEEEGVQPPPFAVMNDDYPLLNGRGYPDTAAPGALTDALTGLENRRQSSLITATSGDRILLRVSSLATGNFYTLTAQGLPMQVVGRDARLLRGPTGLPLYADVSSITLGGGQSVDVLIDTAGVTPGTYVLHTTNLNYLSNGGEDFGGLMTEIVIGQ